jgi:cell wall-associated NlpC family hydrolase
MRHNNLYLMAFIALLGGCAGVAPSPSPSVAPAAEASFERGGAATDRSEALLQALSALGTSYHYGGDTYATGFDCSGLVAHVFLEAYGIRLPHSARAQSRLGTPVSLADLQAGDLVFYNTEHRPYSHVGIYLGDGEFIHAPKTGTRVRVEEMSNPYWASHYDGARRIAPPQTALQ